VTVCRIDLGVMLPMHLVFTSGAAIISAGRTLRKLIGGATRLDEAFLFERPGGFGTQAPRLARRIAGGERVLLRLRAHPGISLRGAGCAIEEGFLLDLGFGMSLVRAVRLFDLDDSDFTASELAPEMLFLHEANRAAMEELARTNHRLEAARASAANLAVTDPLTGLLNRRGFQDALAQALRNAQSLPFALAQLDLDDFKLVNDRHGHAAGDLVLQAVARILRDETRAADRVSRTGGDEFQLILTGRATCAELEEIGCRITDSIRRPIPHEGATLRVSASIGFSRSADHRASDAAGMIATADAALYRAKARRRRASTEPGGD